MGGFLIWVVFGFWRLDLTWFSSWLPLGIVFACFGIWCFGGFVLDCGVWVGVRQGFGQFGVLLEFSLPGVDFCF